MSSPVNPITSGTNTPGTTSSPASKPATDPLASESTFLTLLVSQLKNQDPLNPTDSTQFVSQLTAYSQLEQLIGIKANTTPTNSTTTNPTTGTGN
ncbi:MAG TPA: flagellar hook capping FlgD N-terminal domain-containing protein [Bryobacteraceae bacterium]|jgi:flagellar basal-body rod modification protein FlgD|nr:flagellar hook capping FlgD N-terminal domain-containing protein [Bryobacteraceae bacterium]